jgi:biopolymer transport protein TolR
MRSRRRRHRYELNADINVVSLIDVMLLLLVIFMITAPMMQGGLDLKLPEANAQPLESRDGVTISVTKTGDIYLGNEKYNLSEFRALVRTLPKNRFKSGVYLQGDTQAAYGTIIQVFSVLQQNGITNIGLMAVPEENR